MKKTSSALFILTALVVASACRKHPNESPDVHQQAMAPLEAGPDAGALTAGGNGMDAGLAATEASLDAGTSDAGSAEAGMRGTGVPAKATLEQCMDAWLTANGFDRFGHAAGTIYAGGTPLFDERTGRRQERVSYVMRRQPAVRAACGASDAG